MPRAGQISVTHTSERLRLAMAVMGGRLAELLTHVSRRGDGSLPQAYAFLRESYEAAAPRVPVEAWQGSTLENAAEEIQPVDRLAACFDLSDLEVQLLLLASMADEHEGYAAVLRSLHPRGESSATLGLAAQLLFERPNGREALRALVQYGSLCRSGIVEVAPGAPFWDRSLQAAQGLWSALHDVEAWPAELTVVAAPGYTAGLEGWLGKAEAVRAVRALLEGRECVIAVVGEDAEADFHRAIALVLAAGRRPVGFAASAAPEEHWQRLLGIHAVLRDVVPVVRIVPGAHPENAAMARTTVARGPMVIACAEIPEALYQGRPLMVVPVEPIDALDRRRMWTALLPALKDSAEKLASRYQIEPYRVIEVAADLELVGSLEQRPPTLADVAESVRSRARRSVSAGALWVQPKASWDDLVLPSDLVAQLNEAVDRLNYQSRVLDDWGFLRDRRGSRGLRLLFAGPPGTGKTLSAEVLAHALGADLLIVDLSRMVSKWIGETEKNLAAVFDAAEGSQTVLFFDEADALFAKRTEVLDAHARYANLETSYLLQRLEQFDGLAILATNLKQNIDAAFVRRLEFVLTFTEPDRELRAALWKRHIPDGMAVDAGVNFATLAALYPLVGATIRNAAVAAAFRAASEGSPLSQDHFVQAIRREYEKLGKAFPGRPANVRD